MLRRLRDYENFEVWSRDGGDLGRVEDFHFDEDRWTIRYVVIKTGGWFTGRSVLAVAGVHRLLALGRGASGFQSDGGSNQERAQRRSRSVDLREADYSGYYGIPDYWAGPGLWGMWTTPAEARAAATSAERRSAATRDSRHLRSMRDLTGCPVHAQNGEIGHVEDLLVDDDSWSIRYLMIDTSNWIGGRTVLLAPEWSNRIDWASRQVHVEVTRDEVEASPEYDPAADIDGAYEERLAEALRRSVRGL